MPLLSPFHQLRFEIFLMVRQFFEVDVAKEAIFDKLFAAVVATIEEHRTYQRFDCIAVDVVTVFGFFALHKLPKTDFYTDFVEHFAFHQLTA